MVRQGDQDVGRAVHTRVVGATLLAGAYALGIVNRWREGGWRTALVATSGVAGAALFLASSASSYVNGEFIVVDGGGLLARVWTALLGGATGALFVLFSTNPPTSNLPTSWFVVFAALTVVAVLVGNAQHSKSRPYDTRP